METDKILEAAARAAREHQGQLPSPTVQPQPVPMSIQMTQTRGPDGQSYVILIIQTPVGQSVFYFDPDDAASIAKGLENASRQARTGLEIPSALIR